MSTINFHFKSFIRDIVDFAFAAHLSLNGYAAASLAWLPLRWHRRWNVYELVVLSRDFYHFIATSRHAAAGIVHQELWWFSFVLSTSFIRMSITRFPLGSQRISFVCDARNFIVDWKGFDWWKCHCASPICQGTRHDFGKKKKKIINGISANFESIHPSRRVAFARTELCALAKNCHKQDKSASRGQWNVNVHYKR